MKQPTKLNLGDRVKLYGREFTVIEVDGDGLGRVVVGEANRHYVRSVFFVEHKNMWRTSWYRLEKWS